MGSRILAGWPAESGGRGQFMWVQRPYGRYCVHPVGDHACIWQSAICTTDDFGNLVRVPA